MINWNQLPAYEMVRTQQLVGLNSEGVLLKHKKTGARICLFMNSDENKVFQIGFRTPPKDDTGVPHIIEHTVLCGSDKFPLKDPFVELVKGSMNTFLNAITYSDKTIYPVASCNDKDFANLMNVYLDAVFHPNIYKYEEIFKQEGWHYELQDVDGPLTINGVVYNEMKGAYSDPEEILQHEIMKSLYPDTCYSQESGGHPDHICELSREAFLDFHQTYYHPSNAFIYLYGDMDMEEKLNWLDQEYLSTYEALKVDSQIQYQEPFETSVEKTVFFPLPSSESEKDNAIISYNLVIGDSLDKEMYIAISILNYALFNAPGARVKKELLDAKIGKEIHAEYDTSLKQPLFSIVVKGTQVSKKDEFVSIIQQTIKDLIQKGISKEAIEAGLNSSEFKYREADFGQFPKGLFYCIQSMDSWLYNEDEPFVHIDSLDTYAFLREQIGTDYYEQILEKYFLQNQHCSIVMMEPKKGLNALADEALEKELEQIKLSMTADERKKLVEETKHLKVYQETPSTKEEMDKIPMLSRKDIKKEAMPLDIQTKSVAGVLTFHHEFPTNGIHYLKLMFDVKKLPVDMIPYLGLLRSIFSYVDTDKHTYTELSNEIDRFTGGISGTVGVYQNVKAPDAMSVKFEIKCKTLYEQMPKAIELISEILEGSKYDDYKRLYELIAEMKSRIQSNLSNSGSATATLRANSYFSKAALLKDKIGGIDFYREIARLEKNFETEKASIASKLKRLATIIFRKENLTISSTCTQEEFQRLEPQIKEFNHHLSDQDFTFSPSELVCEKKNEGFMDASQVQYVVRAGSYADAGYGYVGAMRVVKTILSYEYLWIEVRVKGGAYGCGGSFGRMGAMNLSSYRDPNLAKTNDVFERTPEFLASFEADEKEMTKYVIGTVSEMDTPLTPALRGERSMTLYLCNLTIQDIQKERDEVLKVKAEDIRALANPVRAVLKQGYLCVVGNEENIKEANALFLNTENL